MSDNQKFPVAVHALLYLAHKDASSARTAVNSAELAASMPTNPVVVRRVTAMLGRAGLIESRPGASGGAWLRLAPDAIRLDAVLSAVHGCASLGCAPPGARGCPVGERIPEVVSGVLRAVSEAASERLARVTLADLLAEVSERAGVQQAVARVC
jgi:DNA-binding IscR family transcriptional regulator